ncbi:hypothetical protein F0562_029793 [Nyssa sinensis]|uniref:Sodium/calcium exchanger membrane region domain-containing protein n=1 Tax=Nyssa sinensis TaxID=561372 RepID=A0A5J5AUF2_9ASTE|nr:hypothetical protein F0562_029793 [Nyssa sinensis]
MEDLNGFYYRRHSRFRGVFNGICATVLFLFFYFHEEGILKSHFITKSPPVKWGLRSGSYDETARVEAIHRRIAEISVNSLNYTLVDDGSVQNNLSVKNPTVCAGLYEQKGYRSRCEYLIANPQCTSGGFFNYIVFFYCDCETYSYLGYLALGVWLAALFYLLGNTAADYFCCCLEKLSNLLKLPPTVAGVTLLPFGNGAPDVFSSIAAFVGSEAGDMGFNIALGGAVFVTCIVVGIVSIRVAEQGVQIDKRCFIRDVAIYSNEAAGARMAEIQQPCWGWNDEETVNDCICISFCSKLFLLLEMPLMLPRRLTIPMVDEERWSKGYAVASASLAPMLLAFLWNTQDNIGSLSGEIAYFIGIVVGGTLGVLAFIYTRADQPPYKFLFPWVLGGFCMSIVWFYLVANELVALLVALGVIFGIKPSILGFNYIGMGQLNG